MFWKGKLHLRKRGLPLPCSLKYLLSPASDLLNGCLSYLSMVRNSVVLFEGFLSPSDHSRLLSMISVDDVLVFWVPLELVRYNTQQTTANLKWKIRCRVFFVCSSALHLYLVASLLQQIILTSPIDVHKSDNRRERFAPSSGPHRTIQGATKISNCLSIGCEFRVNVRWNEYWEWKLILVLNLCLFWNSSCDTGSQYIVRLLGQTLLLSIWKRYGTLFVIWFSFLRWVKCFSALGGLFHFREKGS